MLRQGVRGSDLFRVIFSSGIPMPFWLPVALPNANRKFLNFVKSSFSFLILRLNASLRCFRIFLETTSYSFFGTSLSFRCAQTETLPISLLDLRIVIP